MFVPVQDVLEDCERYENRVLSLKGEIILGADAVVAQSYAAFKRGQAIAIRDCPQIAESLRLNFPPYGGGDISWHEQVHVTGKVLREADQVVLREITYCKLLGESIEVVVTID